LDQTKYIMEKLKLFKKLFPIVTIVFLLAQTGLKAQDSNVRPCSEDPNFQQFDFWLGTWDVKGHEGQEYGHNTIEAILDGCVLLENWTGAKSSKGKSFNFYDRHSGKWIQRWVDNSGGNLDLKGDIVNGAAVFLGKSKNRKGEDIHNRLTIKKASEKKVFQIWEQSKDSISWQKVFDAVYHKTSK